MSVYNTGVQLGEMVFGRPTAGQEAYAKGLLVGSRARDAMQAARLERAKAIFQETRNHGLGDLTPAGVGSTLDITDPAAQQTALDLAVANGGDIRKLGDVGHPDYLKNARAATQAANTGDVAGENLHLGVMSGKPFTSTKITPHGEVYNPTGAPTQPVTIDRLGNTLANLNTAKAGAAHAAAHERNAHAGLYEKQTSVGGFNPHTERNRAYWPNSSTLKSMLTVPPSKANGYKGGVDHASLAEIIRWHANHPQASWSDYLAQNDTSLPLTDAWRSAQPRVGVSSPEALGETPLPSQAGAASAGEPPLGSAGNPAYPTTQADFAALPSGAYFINPATGTLMRKK